MKRKNIHTLLLGALFFVGASLCSSCADDLETLIPQHYSLTLFISA